MSLNTSKIILKVVGIISTISGGLGTVLGLVLTIASFVIANNPSYGDANDMGITLVAGIIMLIISIMPLVMGIFALIGAKDSSKIIPAWVISIISLVISTGGLLLNFVDFMGVKIIIASLAAFMISIVIFLAANTIKKNR